LLRCGRNLTRSPDREDRMELAEGDVLHLLKLKKFILIVNIIKFTNSKK
jgi:hypothetical protein